ncbi:MAG: hypothetical protein RSC28_00905 [Bacteroidales bacterium]
MKNIKYTISLLLCLYFFTILQGQNTIPNKNKQVDMKEFDENSFDKAMPKKIIDSTLLTQHLIGVKWGYAISNVGFSQDTEHKSIKSPVNFGVYYTYYHSLWKSMPYFGLHTGIEVTELGFTEITGKDPQTIVETEQRYRAIEVPLLTQFRVDFWKMRIMLGAGLFGSYIISTNMEGGIPETTNRTGYGIMAGGGLAFILKPFEIHVECNYKYSLSHFLDPQIYSAEYWIYTHSTQLKFSVGLFYRLGKNKKK